MIKKTFLIVVSLLFLLTIILPAYSADTISPEDAINHIGENRTVCGVVASSHYAYRSKGQPTFINLDKPHPGQIFTALIWGSDRSNFPGAPEDYYRGKRICVSGKIQQYKGKPEIIVRNANQIREEK